MKLTAGKIAEITNGVVEGDAEIVLTGLAGLDEAAEGQLSFLYNPKYVRHIYAAKASAVLVASDFQPDQPVSTVLIRVEDPYRAFNAVLRKYAEARLPDFEIDGKACISASAVLQENVYVGANAFIGADAEIKSNTRVFPGVFIGNNVKVGENCIIYPNASIYDDSIIGDNCIIHSNAVIGGDGFGFLLDNGEAQNEKIPQIGNVVLEDNVEIGANTCVDRATLGSTVIEKNVKLDNLIQIGHNCRVGEGTVIAAQTGLSGGMTIGKRCRIGGQVGFTGHFHIADDTTIGGQAGVTKAVKEPGKVWRGAPLYEIRQQMRYEVAIRQMPEYQRKIDELERRLEELINTTEDRPH